MTAFGNVRATRIGGSSIPPMLPPAPCTRTHTHARQARCAQAPPLAAHLCALSLPPTCTCSSLLGEQAECVQTPAEYVAAFEARAPRCVSPGLVGRVISARNASALGEDSAAKLAYFWSNSDVLAKYLRIGYPEVQAGRRRGKEEEGQGAGQRQEECGARDRSAWTRRSAWACSGLCPPWDPSPPYAATALASAPLRLPCRAADPGLLHPRQPRRPAERILRAGAPAADWLRASLR